MTTTDRAAQTSTQHGLGRLLGSTGVAITGHGMLTAAAPLMAASLTRNPLAVSAVTAGSYAAWLFIGLPAGALVDRWPRRRVMVTTDLLRACALLGLAALIAVGHASIAAVVLTVLLVGVGSCFFDPAAQAAIPAVVGRDKDVLSRANGRMWALDTFGRSLAGPPLGAALFSVAAVLPFAIDGVALLSSALILSGLGALAVKGNGAQPERLVQAVRNGVSYLFHQRELRQLTFAMAAYNLGYNVAFATLVLFAQDHLGVSDIGYGVLIAAMALGGVAGGWIAPRLPSGLSALHVYAFALAMQALAWLLVIVIPSPWVAGAGLALVGVASTTVSVVGGSARQLLTPDNMLGRVVSVTRLLGIGSAAIGALLGGGVADLGGVVAPFVVAAVALVAFSATFAVLAVRRFGSAS